MKLTTLLIFVALFQVSANSYSQQTRLNLKFKNETLETVFSKIEANSEFSIFYKNELIQNSTEVSGNFKDALIFEILDQVLKSENLSYTIKDKLIVILPKEEVASQMITQQPNSLTGKVTDAAGEPLPGVSIVLKGTTTGTITDANGKFSLSNLPENATLQFSFVGMKTQEIPVEGKTSINLTLQEETIGIEEVVAIGYGVAKRSDITGAIASVSSKSYENQPVTNVTSALQGRAAGVSIANLSGAPGGRTHIRIRGANSISGGNEPLYVVDGMQMVSFNLNDINPADVENFEILKDASATAIYGSRGANGVVLVTTKKGKTEKATIEFETNQGISNRAKKYDLMDPVSYANQVNLGLPDSYTAAQIEALKNGGGTDWQDAISQTGHTQEYLLSISGSSPKSSYYISGRYLDQTGIIINSNYKLYSFHTNIESKITDKITFNASTFLHRSEGFNNQNNGSLNGGVEQSITWGPAESIFEADGVTYNIGDPIGAIGPNPVANLRYFHQKIISNSLLLNTKLTYKIFDFLTLDIGVGMDADLSEADNMNVPPYAPYGVLSAGRQHNTSMGFQNSNVLTFHKLMGNHDLTATGVIENSKGTYDYTMASGSGSAFTEKLQYYALGTMVDKNIGSGYGMSSLLSYVGRVSYAFSSKYLLTASYRADGSSKFPNNKWGYFPSVGLGWRASEESFIKDLGIFSNLKIRGGYGVTGNQGAPAFATIPKMTTGNYAYGTSSGLYSNVSNSIGDPDLRWEQTAQTDIGIDLGFFDNRLNISADYFNKQTTDLLMPVPIPIYWGGGSKQANVGSVENKGVEFVVSATPVDTKDFTWNVSFNYTSYKNKVLELGGGATSMNSSIENVVGNGLVQNNLLRNIVGESMGTFMGIKFLGIYQENEAAEAALYGMKPGDSKYEDLNGDHKIDGEDWQITGHSLPKYSFGLDNTVRFKDFELNVFVMGVQGNDIWDMSYLLSCVRMGGSKTITNAEVIPWTTQNKSSEWPSLVSTTNVERGESSKWILDGSFLRIKNVSLTYRIPPAITWKVPVKLSVSGQNLYTFTKYKGADPEASSGGDSDINQGIVAGAYPSPRVITFSLQLNF